MIFMNLIFNYMFNYGDGSCIQMNEFLITLHVHIVLTSLKLKLIFKLTVVPTFAKIN